MSSTGIKMADDPAILNDCQGLSAKWKWTYRHEDRLRNLLYTGFQSDLVLHLRPAGTKVPVHKIFLQAGSPVLNSRIMSNGTKEELIIENVDTRVFQKFLMFLYTGKSNAKIGSALPLLQLATEYEVNGLRDYCVNILKGTLTLENVLSLFSSGMEYAHGDFIQYTLNFICENASKVLQSEKFTQLRLDCLIEIIQEDSLQVKDEMEVFDAVNRWGLAECARQSLDPDDLENLQKCLTKPLKHIRFPLMDPADFALIVKPKKLLKLEELVDLLASFLVPVEKREMLVLGTFVSTPRQYTGAKNDDHPISTQTIIIYQ